MVNSGLCSGRDALVAEVAVDLVDPLDAADHQALEVQLRRDAQVERACRARCGASRTAAPARRRRSAASSASRPRGSRARSGSRGSPPAIRLRSLEDPSRLRGSRSGRGSAGGSGSRRPAGRATSPGSGTQALGEERQARRPDGELVGLRAEQVPAHADEVAEVEQPEDPEVAVADRILPDVDLDARDGRRSAPGSSPCRSCGWRECARSSASRCASPRAPPSAARRGPRPAGRSCRCVRTRAGRDRRQAGPAPRCWRGAGRSVRVLGAYLLLDRVEHAVHEPARLLAAEPSP